MGDEDLAGLGRHEIFAGIDPALCAGGAEVIFTFPFEVGGPGEVRDFLVELILTIQNQ